MYIPSKFKVTDTAIIEKFMAENGFATLISKGEVFPAATHIPIQLQVNAAGEKVLWGHLSRGNPQWKLFAAQPEVLVVFMADLSRYISSSWYNFPEAPTWNYMSVQISGKIKVVEEDVAWESISRLTDTYEKNMACPVSMNTLPESVTRQVKGVVAFEIEIVTIEAAFKMSQTRDDENFALVLEQLRKSGDPGSLTFADMMEQIRKNEL